MVPELLQHAAVVAPLAAHADEELQKDLSVQKSFYFMARLGADPLQHLPFLADDDPRHVRSIDLPCQVDRAMPRTVIVIKRYEEKS